MSNINRDELFKWVDDHEKEYIEDLKGFCSIDSVKSAYVAGMPLERDLLKRCITG